MSHGETSEYAKALETLLKLEDKLRNRKIPPERYELLLDLAHRRIRDYRDISEVADIIVRLCDVLVDST